MLPKRKGKATRWGASEERRVAPILFRHICGVWWGLSTGHAEDAAEFYKSHSVTLGVPNSAGGGYDVYARALARHLGNHIPGKPTIVVQDVPAAGGMVLANQLYTSAPRDGSYIGMIRGTVVQEQVYKSPQVQFDARKFEWIGNMNSDYDACVVSAEKPGQDDRRLL